ncbi:hypothetical protein [Azospirillum sp.]|uniref:hypothetical protein n=1 Tax=Azospirillum sp. TaxID=34012 RepID=UPI003D744B56
MPTLRRTAVLTLAAALLAGCWSPKPGPLAAITATADVVAVTTTKKTIANHIESGITGRDCSVVSYEQTGELCPEPKVVDRSNIYCYRTLADVNCHYLPDPYKNGQTALASPPPVYKTVPPKPGWFDGVFD